MMCLPCLAGPARGDRQLMAQHDSGSASRTRLCRIRVQKLRRGLVIWSALMLTFWHTKWLALSASSHLIAPARLQVGLQQALRAGMEQQQQEQVAFLQGIALLCRMAQQHPQLGSLPPCMLTSSTHVQAFWMASCADSSVPSCMSFTPCLY